MVIDLQRASECRPVISGKLAKQHEIPQRITNRLLVQRRPEDAGVEPCGGRRIRHDDVEVLEAKIRERKRRLGRHAHAGPHKGHQERQSTERANDESGHAILLAVILLDAIPCPSCLRVRP